MKRSALVLIASLGIGLGTAFAMPQDAPAGPPPDAQGARRGGGPRWDPQQRVNMLAKRLKLTDDQKQKLLPIFTDEQQQMKSLRDDSSLAREDRMAKMKSIRENSDTQINGILNDDQKQKYAQMQEQMRQRMQERMKEHGANGDAGAPPPPQNQ